MNTKHLLCLTTILGVIAALLSAQQIWTQSRKLNWELPESRGLLPREALEEAHGIQLKSGSSEVILQKNAQNRWIIPGYHGLEADPHRLRSLTDAISQSKIQRYVTRSEEKMEQLGLNQYQLILLDADGKTRSSFQWGRNGKNGGNFVKRHGEDAAYLSDLTFSPTFFPIEWSEKRITDLDPTQISQIKLSFPDARDAELVVTRNGTPAQYELAVPTDNNEKIDQGKWDSLMRYLPYLRMSSVHSADQVPGVQSFDTLATRLELKLADGSKLQLSFARMGRVLKADGSEEATPGSPTAPVFLKVEGNSPHIRIPEASRNLYFEIPDHAMHSFPKTRAECLVANPAEEIQARTEP
jgi:hypothetical protein